MALSVVAQRSGVLRDAGPLVLPRPFEEIA